MPADRSAQLNVRQQGAKLASRSLVEAAGGQERATKHCRIKRQQALSDMVGRNVDRFMDIDIAIELESVTKGTPEWPQVTRYMAEQQNCAVVVLPEAELSARDFHAAVAALIRESHDVSTRLIEALGDGIVTPGEVRQARMIEETNALIGAGVNLRAMLERVLAGEG